MIKNAKYLKVVGWSDKTCGFIGHCRGIIGLCCHGDDKVEVYRELC